MYQTCFLTPLSAPAIIQYIGPLSSTLDHFEILAIVDSTNNYLLAKKHLNKNYAVLAETQTAGRGRFNHKWISPAHNIYLSLLWHFKTGFSSLTQLYYQVGLIVVKTLQINVHTDIYLKKPNDVFYEGKKLGGILIDLCGKVTGSCQAIIGIGINIQLPNDRKIHDAIQQPCIDLFTLNPTLNLDRNQLSGLLLKHLLEYLTTL